MQEEFVVGNMPREQMKLERGIWEANAKIISLNRTIQQIARRRSRFEAQVDEMRQELEELRNGGQDIQSLGEPQRDSDPA